MNQLKIKPLILIDTSYTSFYRFFATVKWYSFTYKEEYSKLLPDYDWNTNSIFMEKYEKMFLESIIKLVKKSVWLDSDILFCMDSPKVKLWRTQLQCDYKGNRPDLSLKQNYHSIFEYTYERMIPNILKIHSNIKSMRIDGLEADDLIAIISMELEKVNPTRPVYIVSGDEDFLQLGRANVIFINYRKKEPFKLTKEQATLALAHKIINGDASDCIPGIFPKGTRSLKKTELLNSKDKLKLYLDSNPTIKTQYEINQTMIDFTFIPKKYYSIVIKKCPIELF
jgi:5'-3' exonuclease